MRPIAATVVSSFSERTSSQAEVYREAVVVDETYTKTREAARGHFNDRNRHFWPWNARRVQPGGIQR